MSLIDFHTHLLPDPLLQPALAEYRDRLWLPRYRGTEAELWERLAGAPLDYFAVMPYATAPGQSRHLNQWCAALAQRDRRVVPFATFHPGDDDLVELFSEAFDKLGLAGIELHCQAGQFYPDDRRLFPLYERAMERDLVVTFHVARAPFRNRYVGAGPFYQLLRRFPRLHAVVAHLGADETDAFFDLAMVFDELYLDTSLVFCDRFPWAPRLERVIEFQDRILYASGFPFSPSDLLSGVDAIKQLGLGPGIETKLLFTNAARLLDLDL